MGILDDIGGAIAGAAKEAAKEVEKRFSDVTEGRRLSAYETYKQGGKTYDEVKMLQEELHAVKDSNGKPYYNGKADGKLDGNQQAIGEALVRFAGDKGLELSAEADPSGKITEVRIPDATRSALFDAYNETNPKLKHPQPRTHQQVIIDDTKKGVDDVKENLNNGSLGKLVPNCPRGTPEAVCNSVRK